jgi:hypothetical protein
MVFIPKMCAIPAVINIFVCLALPVLSSIFREYSDGLALLTSELPVFQPLHSILFKGQFIFPFILHAFILNTFPLFSSQIVIDQWIIW